MSGDRSKWPVALALAMVVVAAGGCGPLRGGGTPEAAPGPRTVPADYAELGGVVNGLDELDITGGTEFPEKKALLRGPHFELHLREVGATAGLSAAAADKAYLFEEEEPQPEYQAGTGRELLVARVEEKRQSIGSQPEQLQLNVRVDGVDRPVRMDRWPSNSLIAVSVPTGTDAELSVTDVGRRQSISLRTGRVLESIEGYYPPRTGGANATVKVQVTAPGVRLFWGNPVEVDAYLTVKLDPYTEQGGWAPVGKTWLTGTVSVSLGEPELTATIDAARSFRVTGPGGLVLRAPTGRLVIKSDSGLPGVGGSSNDATVFAEVPADLKRLTLTFLPEGSFAVAETGVPVRWRALARTATDTMVIRAR